MSSMSGKSDGTSQSTRALLRLRELLISGEFEPGTRMSELPLVERLGVSRTPLRLALATLEHEGLLELLPGGGYATRQFSQADVTDAIELRGVLEGTAARWASERGVPRRELTRMATLVDRMDVEVHEADYGSFVNYVELNKSFHVLLVEAARSPMLERAVADIVALPFASASAFVLAEAELPESRQILLVAQDQHRALLEAIQSREGARAESIGREHARLARRNLDVAMDNHEVMERMPEASLIRLPGRLPAQPDPAEEPAGSGDLA
jgi:GntR family transcriptional regulator, vanillate catabolism transcriptional regulator